jgi:hypothetical protein
MIWLCMVILTVALALQNKTISELQYEVDWLQLQMALMEEEKDESSYKANENDI